MSYSRFGTPPHNLYSWPEGGDDDTLEGMKLALWFNHVDEYPDGVRFTLHVDEVRLLKDVCNQYLADMDAGEFVD